MSAVTHFSPEEVQQARQVDLLTYLKKNDPDELVRESTRTFCTRKHDSLKISNGKWYWFSREIGGVSALDYLIKVRGLTFLQAVESVLGKAPYSPPDSYIRDSRIPKRLILPEKNNTAEHVISYLTGRGIHPEIVRHCLDRDLLYESRGLANAVFVGHDGQGRPRYAAIRSTTGPYKGDAAGSDKHYSFRLTGMGDSRHLHVFESAIDLLSYATLLQMRGRDWRQDALLSLAGVYHMTRRSVLPVALQKYLEEHPGTVFIHLHLDNDEVGRLAAEGIRESLDSRYRVLNEPPECGKDINDQLRIQLITEQGRGVKAI
ncbi:MAG: DUF3991 and TOPRIM domain-containing protein [Oscillospiraceae bacterium]|nr:DUF3991 and TOPRIM domain-containing protein [Oscillospiraceae bacterium]